MHFLKLELPVAINALVELPLVGGQLIASIEGADREFALLAGQQIFVDT